MGRNDYTKAERDAWQAQRLAGERARAPHMAGMNNLPRTAQGIINPKTGVSYEYEAAQRRLKATEKKVSKEMNAAIREKIYGEVKKVQQTRAEMQAAAKAGKSLHALMPSTCLQSLTWKNGVATAEFYRGGAITYEYEMDLDEFIDWAESGSLGKYGNENVF